MLMGSHGSGRRENVYDYSSLGNQLFIPVHEFLRCTNMKYSTLHNYVCRAKIFSVKNGKQSLILNPCADFGAAFDALPALLSYTQVCDFFGVKRLSPGMIAAIGFFHIPDENAPHTDKKSLANYLEEELCNKNHF